MPGKVVAIVAYPSKTESGEPATFDMAYYKATHMPMIEKAWGPHGFISWSINEFPTPCPLTGQTPPYSVQTTANFKSMDDFKAALANGGQATQDDVKNFSNVAPVIWVGAPGANAML